MSKREIKFRQRIGNKWHYWGFIDGIFIEPAVSTDISLKEVKENSYQFTGLKDKNGKEIYDLWQVCEEVEIIGNIYENPELLK